MYILVTSGTGTGSGWLLEQCCQILMWILPKIVHFGIFDQILAKVKLIMTQHLLSMDDGCDRILVLKFKWSWNWR